MTETSQLFPQLQLHTSSRPISVPNDGSGFKSVNTWNQFKIGLKDKQIMAKPALFGFSCFKCWKKVRFFFFWCVLWPFERGSVLNTSRPDKRGTSFPIMSFEEKTTTNKFGQFHETVHSWSLPGNWEKQNLTCTFCVPNMEKCQTTDQFIILTVNRGRSSPALLLGSFQREQLSVLGLFYSVPTASWQARSAGMWGCSVLVCWGVSAWSRGCRRHTSSG